MGVARLASSGGDEACHANLGKVQLEYKHFKLSTWVHLFPPSDCLMFRVPPLSPWYYLVFFLFLTQGKEMDTQAGLTTIDKGQFSNLGEILTLHTPFPPAESMHMIPL